jgi:hypothetical protein
LDNYIVHRNYWIVHLKTHSRRRRRAAAAAAFLKNKKVLRMKLAIVGYRGFNDYDRFKRELVLFIEEYGEPLEIISGGAKGADSLAERYAREENLPVIVLKADWKSHGRRAGVLRNTDIIARATHALAFPSKNGKGTQDSTRKARQLKKPVKEIWV